MKFETQTKFNMFSQILRRSLQASTGCKNVAVRLCSTISEPKLAPTIEEQSIHNVRVTGKVTSTFYPNNDQVVFYINSICNGNFRKVHKIVVSNRNPALLNLAKSKLEKDQSVSIEGKLSTMQFQTADKKRRSNSAIIATELCIISDFAVVNNQNQNQNQYQSIDENCVELLGSVVTDIRGSDFKTFTLSSVKNPNLSRTNPSNRYLNRIFVYDKDLFPILHNIRAKRCELLVRGDISYRLDKNEFGKNVSSSYIIAKQMYRI